MRKTAVCLIAAFLTALPAFAQESEPERIELIPEEKAGWSPRNVGAGVSTVFRGTDYWYENKEFLVETVPTEAQLALYYIRSNFQKVFERAVSPVIVVAPKRIHATSKDVITVRVASPGYLTKEVKFRVFALPENVVVKLDPLPNALTFLGHTHLAGRSTITLRTTEEPEIRISKSRGSPAFRLALTQTANQLEAKPKPSGIVEKLTIDQVGEDLMVAVKSSTPEIDVRSKASYDPIRKEHIYILDITEKGSRPPDSTQVRRELDAVRYARGGRCNEIFADTLRQGIDEQMMARAFRPSGGLAEYYQREAMMRLGRLNSGSVQSASGEAYRTGSPIELAMALQSASRVRDYLSFLGAVARTRPDPPEFMRALLAPEMSASEFNEVYDRAVAAQRSCS